MVKSWWFLASPSANQSCAAVVRVRGPSSARTLRRGKNVRDRQRQTNSLIAEILGDGEFLKAFDWFLSNEVTMGFGVLRSVQAIISDWRKVFKGKRHFNTRLRPILQYNPLVYCFLAADAYLRYLLVYYSHDSTSPQISRGSIAKLHVDTEGSDKLPAENHVEYSRGAYKVLDSGFALYGCSILLRI